MNVFFIGIIRNSYQTSLICCFASLYFTLDFSHLRKKIWVNITIFSVVLAKLNKTTKPTISVKLWDADKICQIELL